MGKQLRLIIIALLAGTIWLPAANAEYLAYSVTKEKERPLPEAIDEIESEYLVNLRWSDYPGRRARVGVLDVQNTSSAQSFSITGPGGRVVDYKVNNGSGVPVQGIEAILTDVLNRSNRFRIVERKVLDKTLKEQDLGASGRVAKPSAAKIGKVLGAEYLIRAVVTSYEPNFEGKNVGLGAFTGGLLGGLKFGSKKSMVGMNFRLIDAETSEVVYTKQVQAIVSQSSFGFGGAGFGGGGALGGFLSSYTKTPVGQAVIAAVNKGVYDLVRQVGAKPVSGKVVTVKSGKVYLNLRKGQVEPGEELKVFTKGEELVDPDTGLVLGGDDELLGRIQVTSVKEKFSLAKPIDVNLKRISRGSRVVSTRTPPQAQYAAKWEAPKKATATPVGGNNR